VRVGLGCKTKTQSLRVETAEKAVLVVEEVVTIGENRFSRRGRDRITYIQACNFARSTFFAFLCDICFLPLRRLV